MSPDLVARLRQSLASISRQFAGAAQLHIDRATESVVAHVPSDDPLRELERLAQGPHESPEPLPTPADASADLRSID